PHHPYPLSLHDALPIWGTEGGRSQGATAPLPPPAHGGINLPPPARGGTEGGRNQGPGVRGQGATAPLPPPARGGINLPPPAGGGDRKSTRLNSSHQINS